MLSTIVAFAAVAVLLGAVPIARAAACDDRREACCCAKQRREAPSIARTNQASDAPVLARAACCEPADLAWAEPPPARAASEPHGAPPPAITSAVVAVPRATPRDDASLAACNRGRGPPACAHDHLLAKSSLLL
jgi:hypothetical protein